MKKFVLPLIALFALTFGLVSMVRSQTGHETNNPPSAPPESDFEHTVAAVGLVESSTENIAIGSPLSDVATAVFVTVGQSVKTGEPLFKLDDRQRLADREARRAELQVAESQVNVDAALLDDVTHQLNFAESLTDKAAISAEELTRRRSAVATARARVEAAKAQVASAQAQIQMIETEIERSTVRASVDGEVLQVKIHPGEFAPAGVTATPLIVLGRLNPLYVRVDVDEHEAWRVRPEARATAAIRGNSDLKTPLTFVRFEPLVIPKKSLTGDSTERVDTRVLQALYRVDNNHLRLFVGQQMDVFIDAAQSTPAVTAR
jgi:multidrug efflux pump subunit AcrA (membrane-fusion protein)